MDGGPTIHASAEINLQQITRLGRLAFTLYDETFAGRAQSIQRHYYCVNELHLTANCTYAPVDHLPSSFHLHGQSQRSLSYSTHKQGMYLTTSHADMPIYAGTVQDGIPHQHVTETLMRWTLPYVHYHTSRSIKYQHSWGEELCLPRLINKIVIQANPSITYGPSVAWH